MKVREGRRSIEISSPEKVLFPDDGISKADIASYYSRVATVMVPHLKGRPLTMERVPSGIEGQRFYQKEMPAYFPGWIASAELPKAKGTVRQILCDDAATLLYLVNQNCVTPHVWLSRADRPRHPDQMMFDLDPSRDDFDHVRRTALAARDLLDRLGLPAFVKTTGSRGLHVVVPLDRSSELDDVRDFADRTAALLAAGDPGGLTMEARKADRGDRLFLDTWRNGYAQMAAAPFAVRTRPGAPVATPLTWDEVEDSKLDPAVFTASSVPARLGERGDPWRGMMRHRRSLRGPRRTLERLEATFPA